MKDSSAIKALILDMDGVIWRDKDPIGDLPAIMARIHAKGLRPMFATNNSTRTPKQVCEKLLGMGVEVNEEQIINSSLAVAFLLQKRFPSGSRIYVVGEEGITEALQNAGFEISEENAVAVVAGIDRAFTYQKLKTANGLIRNGALFIGTNPDTTFPTPNGLVPGSGSILASIQTASATAPLIAGKPQPALFELTLERLGLQPHEALVVGDRLDTDILGGQTVGCPTALVLSGISTAEEAASWQPNPDWIAADLAALVEML